MVLYSASLRFLIAIDPVVNHTLRHHVTLHQCSIWLNLIFSNLLEYST